MIIDFSFRPPYKSLANMAVYRRPPEEFMAVKLGMTPSPAALQKSMELLIKEMDEAEIVHGVCHGRAVDGSKNEDMLDLMKEYPGRFTGFAGINLTDMDEAVKETIHCLDDLGFIGVMLEPGMRRPPMYPDDAKMYPIYEICRQRGAKVLYTLSGQVGTDISYCNPVHVDRVAADFPTLDLIIRHACWPWVTETCGMALRRNNIYLIPDAYGVGMPGHTQWVEAANTYLADRMLFGTAFPIVPLKPMVDAYRALPYRDGVREKMEYHNAARLLNLPA